MTTAVQAVSVQIAGKQTHSSHALAWKGGVWFCTSCGGFAKAHIDSMSGCKKLAKPCSGAVDRNGTLVLGRILDGQTPRKGMSWPLDTDVPSDAIAQDMETLWPDRRDYARTVRRRIWGKTPVVAESLEAVVVEDLADTGGELAAGEPFVEVELNEDEDPWGDQGQWEL